MSEHFNPIDNDFACPFACAIETMLTGPGTCVQQMAAGNCVHPAAIEVDAGDLALGALPAQVSLRIFASVFQTETALLVDTMTGDEYLGLKGGDGEFMPISGPLTTLSDEMVDQFKQIQDLPEQAM